MNQAGIVEPQPTGGGTLTTEPILVMRGAQDSDLEAWDQSGRWVGEAINVRDRYSAVRCHFHYDISDAELRCVVTDTTKGRWRWAPKQFLINASNGDELAVATRPQSDRWVPWTFERQGEPIATLREADPDELRARTEATPRNPREMAGHLYERFVHRPPSQLFFLESPSAQRHARISYLRIASLGIQNCLVMETRHGLPDPLPVIALTSCVIANSTMIRGPNEL